MGGAYTAKPAVTVEDERPPGWGDWPWPGPFPPGFDWRDYEWPGLPGGGKPSDDDDKPGDPPTAPRIIVYPTSGMQTREEDRGNVNKRVDYKGYGRNFFYIVLSKAPKKASIFVPVVTRNDDEGRDQAVSEEYTTFVEFPHYGSGHMAWDNPRKIWLAGEDDNTEDGDVAYSFRVGPSSSAYWGGIGPDHVPYPGYNRIYGSDASVTNIETVWELKVRAAYQTSGDVWHSLSWVTGSHTERGKIEIECSQGNVMGQRESLTYMDSVFNVGHVYETTITEVTTGDFGDYGWISPSAAYVRTGRKGMTFKVTYTASATYGVGEPCMGTSGGSSESRLTVVMELYKDGVLQEMFIDAVHASSGGALVVRSKEKTFITEEE